MDVTGKMEVEVRHGKRSRRPPFVYVVKGDGPSLLGRFWIKEIPLEWKCLEMASVASVSQGDISMSDQSHVDALLAKYPEVFEEGLDEMKVFEAELYPKPGSRPKFLRTRPVPFALKETIDRELDRLEQPGITEKVTHSEWAAPQSQSLKVMGRSGFMGIIK